MIIFLFAGTYISNPEDFIHINNNQILDFEEAIYFSTITITTVGYGDITPIGINRIFAALEAFLGMIINVALLGYILSSGRLNKENQTQS
jgi:voltage-gated potassium channel Kch